ncbi:MAG TPA: hypothetical protein VFS55_15525 [Dokdonella sp.]|nr:hypothetical protein [Dokdonella sp.]
MTPRSVRIVALVAALCACNLAGAAAPASAPAPAPKVVSGHDDCAGASVTATYSPQLQFGLDGQNMSPAMFTAEVVRRREGKPLRCVIVVASCRDAALSKQTFKALKPFGVTHMSWQPDRTLFPDSTTKMPECKQ